MFVFMARKAKSNSRRGKAAKTAYQKILRTPKTTVSVNGVVRRGGSRSNRTGKRM